MTHLGTKNGHLVYTSGGHLGTCVTCPSDCSGCASTYYADVTHDCSLSCSGTYQWDQTGSSACTWEDNDSNPCTSEGGLFCSSGEWIVGIPDTGAMSDLCKYRKSASACPAGSYDLDTSYNCTCDDPVSLY